MSNKLLEEILCIKSDILFNKGKWNGIKSDNLDYYYNLLLDKSEFRVREGLETDVNYKQIIPQVILRKDNKYFLHRQVNRNEKRLNGLCPLLLGGHVEKFDISDRKDLIKSALDRELEEEVAFNGNVLNREFVGLVYIEDDNPVNHVHVGLVYIFDVDSDEVVVKEEGLETVGFVDIEYLRKNIDSLTFWSRIFVQEYL